MVGGGVVFKTDHFKGPSNKIYHYIERFAFVLWKNFTDLFCMDYINQICCGLYEKKKTISSKQVSNDQSFTDKKE